MRCFNALSSGLTPPTQPPPVIRPPNAAADHQFVGAQLYLVVTRKFSVNMTKYNVIIILAFVAQIEILYTVYMYYVVSHIMNITMQRRLQYWALYTYIRHQNGRRTGVRGRVEAKIFERAIQENTAGRKDRIPQTWD